MELDERKLKILSAIIEYYIKTGDPVGSKVLSQTLDLHLSSATIRNEMAALFEMGLLEQPHTSAGRAPSHLGYRMYIDRLMDVQPLTDRERAEIDALFNVSNPDPDQLLEDASDALAEYTGCATISTTITPPTVKVRRIEIVPVTSSSVIIIVVASNGVVRNKVCRVPFIVTPEIVDFFHRFANGRLVGLTLDRITSRFVNSVAVTLEEYARMFTPLLSSILELCREINDGQYYVGGTTNLLSYSELAKIARELLPLLENREQLSDLFEGEQNKVRVIVGKENTKEPLTDSAVVIAKYKIGEDNSGAIGVVGPVRMDYAKLIPHLEYFSQTLGRLLKDAFEK